MVAPVPAVEEGQERQFLTFRLDQRLYAVPAADVAEVIRLPPVTLVPQSPAGLLGLANLRGAVIPIASVRGLLGQDKVAMTSHARAIVLEGAATVALAVDAIGDLCKVAATDLDSNAANISASRGELLQGVFKAKSGDAAVKILDVRPMLAAAFTPRPRKEAVSRRGVSGALAQPQLAHQTKLIVFMVAEQEYALPLASVQEVVSSPELATAVPHAQALVVGVISFRDALLPLLSLRGLLGRGENKSHHRKEKIVVLRIGGAPVGLVVDRMTAILSAPDDKLEQMPEMLAARVGGESRIKAIYRGEGGKRLISVLDTGELFGEDVMRKLDGARATTGSAPPPAQTGSVAQFVVFRLGDEEFGLPIEAVDEVLRLPDQIARVPKAPKFLAGVINLRGSVLAVVDQRRRFHMPASEGLASRRLVVVRTQRHRAGLIVDSVSEVQRVPQDEIAPAPALSGESDALVQGVVNLEKSGRIILLLNPSEILTRAEQGLLDKFDRGQAAAEHPGA